MRTTIVVLGMLLATTAGAGGPPKPKPLPAGMKVIAKDNRAVVQQGALTVPLRDDDPADFDKISKVELVEGKFIEVTANRCSGALTDDVTRVPLAKVQAKLDNAAGLAAHAKKQYSTAITKFGSALQKDPETLAYATNLMAAQLLGKKTQLAAQTLAMQGRKNVIWFAWRMAVDADLAGAKALKGAQDFAATKPGTASVGKLGTKDVALSTLGGGMAALHTSKPGQPETTDIDVVSLSTGKLLARLPLTTSEDACDDTPQHPCDDAATARITERTKLADTLLASLGFEIKANVFIDVRNGDPVSRDGVRVEFSDDEITAEKNGAERTLAIAGNASAIAITPTAVIVKLNEHGGFSCTGVSSRFAGAALALP